MTRQLFVLAHDLARRNALEAVRTAPDGMVVEVREKTRTLEQNAKLHAMCADVAKQKQWGGAWITGEDWKRLFVDLYARTSGKAGTKIVPSLDGGGVVILGIQTRNMSVKMLNELIEFIYWWGAENEIKWGEY